MKKEVLIIIYFYCVGSIACLIEKLELLADYHSELSSNFIED